MAIGNHCIAVQIEDSLLPRVTKKAKWAEFYLTFLVGNILGAWCEHVLMYTVALNSFISRASFHTRGKWQSRPGTEPETVP